MFHCVYCRKSFKNPKGFLYHIKVQHELTREFRCGQRGCSRIFSNMMSFRRHIIQHSKHTVQQSHTHCTTSMEQA